jgi:mannose-6-phosphate isomerase-like protein (cupin superfamily)
MAQLIDFAADESRPPWEDLADGEVRRVPLFEGAGVRARVLITRSGSWPSHADEEAEMYVVVRGEVIFHTDHEVRVPAGRAIVFAPGEAHAARIENGAVSIQIDVPRRAAGG